MNLVRFYNSTADNEKNIYSLHAAYICQAKPCMSKREAADSQPGQAGSGTGPRLSHELLPPRPGIELVCMPHHIRPPLDKVVFSSFQNITTFSI